MESVESVIVEVAKRLGFVLKQEQMAIINAFVQGRDVFGILPTGFGKSLCYICLPMIFDELRDDGLSSVIIVLTPLTAIMRDQVCSLQLKGVDAGYICSEADHYDDFSLHHQPITYLCQHHGLTLEISVMPASSILLKLYHKESSTYYIY
jgi:ATP-dependent DNA helicase RecQ